MQRDFAALRVTVADIDETGAGQITAEQMGTHLFELYLALQEFANYREHLTVRYDQQNHGRNSYFMHILARHVIYSV